MKLLKVSAHLGRNQSLALFILWTGLTIGIPSSTFAAASTPACRKSYAEWIQRFGDSDPFLAYQKTTPWDLEKALLQQILGSDGKELARPSSVGEDLKNPRKVKIAESEFNDTVKGFHAGTVRDETIKKNLFKLFSQKVDSDTLVIGYVGLHHTIDFYLSHPQWPLSYMHRPFDLNSKFHSQEFLNFANRPDHLNDMYGDVQSLASFYSSAPYASALAIAERLHTTSLPPNSFVPHSTNPRQILIGEFHTVRSTEISDGLINGACLQKLGITKIIFGIESFRETETISIDFAKRRHNLLEGFTYLAAKRNKSLSEYMNFVKSAKGLSDEVIKEFLAGKAIDNLGMYSFFEKLEQLSKEGIDVQLIGLEGSDFEIH
jgi:hypothetical protein